MSEEIIHEKSCGAVIYRDEEDNGKKIRLFLVLHYPGGHWDFVKGHVEEDDESEEATTLRETKEETGIDDLKLHNGLREVINYEYVYDNQKFSKDVVYFVGKTEKVNIQISHEHQNFEWLPLEKALERLTYENARNILKKASNFLQSQVD